jgi:hypothetical protein
VRRILPESSDVIVEHLPRDRCRRLRAEAAVLDEHAERNPGRIERCIRDEPGVIAQPLVHLARVVLLALERVNLRGAGLPATRVRGLHERRSARALEIHARERLLDEGEMLRPDRHRVGRLRRNLADRPRRGAAHRLHEMRLIRHAIRCDHRDGVRELDRREGVVALTDAGGDAVAEIPLAVFLAIVLAGEALTLPVARRQHARELALDVDARLASETELRQEAKGVVDVGLARENVVVRVARDDDRLVHVDAAMTARLVVIEAVRGARKLEVTWIRDRLRRRAFSRRERGQCEERLYRGAGRICAAQWSIEQRLVGRIVEELPVGGIDSIDEEVRVVARLRDERENLAVARVDRDERAAARAERRLGDFLQLDVEREREVVAGGRRDARQRAHSAAAGVDLDLLDAGRAVQLTLVGELDADLADIVGALVVGALAPLVDAYEVAIVDASDVADRMRCNFAVRILAKEPRLDLDSRKPIAIDSEARDFVVGQLGAKREAFEVLGLVHQLLEALAVARLHLDDLGERIDRSLEILHARGLDFERVRGEALGEDDAIAVTDDAAVGNDRHDRNAIRFGERLIVIVLDDLQEEEAAHQSEERNDDERTGDRQPPPEQEELALGIPELARPECRFAAALARKQKSPHRRFSNGAATPSQRALRGLRALPRLNCARHDRPQQRSDDGRHRIRPARQRRAADEAHEKHERRAQAEKHGDLHRLLPHREAQHAPAKVFGGVGEEGVSERVLAEERPVADVHQQSDPPRDTDADIARLLDAPVEEQQRDEVGFEHQRNAR